MNLRDLSYYAAIASCIVAMGAVTAACVQMIKSDRETSAICAETEWKIQDAMCRIQAQKDKIDFINGVGVRDVLLNKD